MSICPICKSSEEKKPLVAKEMFFGTRKVFNYHYCNQCNCAYLVDYIKDFSQYYPSDCHTIPTYNQPVWKKYALRKFLEYNFYKKGFFGKLVGKIFNLIYGHFPEPNIAWIGEAYRKLGSPSKKIKIIDMGCGGGALLSQLKDLGFSNLLGVEPYPYDVSKKSGLHIVESSIEDFLLKNHEGNFDIVILSHVLEHLFDHEKIINGLKSLLKDNGILVLAMPILGAPFDVYGTNWFSFDAPRHVILHSLSSFSGLVKRSGMDIVDVWHEETNWSLFMSEMYCKGLSFLDIKEYKIKNYLPKHYMELAETYNKKHLAGSSVTFFIKKAV